MGSKMNAVWDDSHPAKQAWIDFLSDPQFQGTAIGNYLAIDEGWHLFARARRNPKIDPVDAVSLMRKCHQLEEQDHNPYQVHAPAPAPVLGFESGATVNAAPSPPARSDRKPC